MRHLLVRTLGFTAFDASGVGSAYALGWHTIFYYLKMRLALLFQMNLMMIISVNLLFNGWANANNVVYLANDKWVNTTYDISRRYATI